MERKYQTELSVCNTEVILEDENRSDSFILHSVRVGEESCYSGRLFREDQFVKRNIGGRDWSTAIHCDDSVWATKDSHEAILFCYKFLKEVFNCRLLVDLKFDKNDPEFKTLLVDTDLLHVADTIVIGSTDEVFSKSEMRHMLDSFHTSSLTIFGRAGRRFKYKKILTKFPTIVLQEPYWLSMEDVWKMVQGGVKDLHFRRNVNWEPEGINEFVKNWLNSDNISFEVLKFVVKTRRRRRGFTLDRLLDGITTSPGCRKRKDAAK